MAAALRHVTKISSLSPKEIAGVLRLAIEMKARPRDYWDALKRKTLLMLFEKPSLRTRVSLEAGMTSLGGHGIAYMTGDSPIGEKETYEDTGAVLSRMADAVTARVKSRDQIEGLAAWSTIPIINALDDLAHPMQMLADLQTIAEHKRGGDVDSLKGVSLAFSGDCQNNVTYRPSGVSWSWLCSILEEGVSSGPTPQTSMQDGRRLFDRRSSKDGRRLLRRQIIEDGSSSPSTFGTADHRRRSSSL